MCKKIESRITFKIKTGYYLELLTSETMKLNGSTKNEITNNKDGENVLHLEITEAVLVHCIIPNNDYQRGSRVLYKFFPNKLHGQLLDISLKSFILLKVFNLQFSFIEKWFTNQNSKPLDDDDDELFL